MVEPSTDIMGWRADRWLLSVAYDSFRPSLYLSIENPPFLALVVEALDESGPLGLPAISVAHYGQQNGDPRRTAQSRIAER
jgi:hypothetical protein